MPMLHADRLRLYLADKDATWSEDGARWSEDGRLRILLVADGALTGEAVIDAHVRAREAGAELVLVHEGAATPVALRTAARFRATLLDVATLPAPTPEAAPVAPPAPVAAVAPTIPAILDPPAPPAAPAIEPPPALLEAAPPAPIASPDEPIVAHSEPEPEVAHEVPGLPWDVHVPTPEPAPVFVDPMEMLSMPWAGHDEEPELLPAGRDARHAPARPTLAPDWGLPWPRPVPVTDGVAIADPRLWRAQERIHAMREDLEKTGVPSFGAVKPEGSAWIKRISEFGGP